MCNASCFLLQCSSSPQDASATVPHGEIQDRLHHLFTLHALQWAKSLWNQASFVINSLDKFIKHLRKVLDNPASKCFSQQTALLSSSRQAVCYRLQIFCSFACMLLARLITAYRQGLKPSHQLHLATYNDIMGLEKFIQLSIHVSHRLKSCSPLQGPWSWNKISTPT